MAHTGDDDRRPARPVSGEHLPRWSQARRLFLTDAVEKVEN
jgi:hypothetical protein